ncbi:MAG: nucleotidyltransferase domain-containing protein [Bacillota bacterium]
MNKNDIKDVLDDIKIELVRIFPNSNYELVLFGSFARDEAGDQSDIDLMLITDMSDDESNIYIYPLAELAADICIKYGRVPTFIIQNRFQMNSLVSDLPFFRNVRKEGLKVA